VVTEGTVAAMTVARAGREVETEALRTVGEATAGTAVGAAAAEGGDCTGHS